MVWMASKYLNFMITDFSIYLVITNKKIPYPYAFENLVPLFFPWVMYLCIIFKKK